MDTEFKIVFADQMSDALLALIHEGKWQVNDPVFRSRIITLSRVIPAPEPPVAGSPHYSLPPQDD